MVVLWVKFPNSEAGTWHSYTDRSRANADYNIWVSVGCVVTVMECDD
jgi:hypothetical protein